MKKLGTLLILSLFLLTFALAETREDELQIAKPTLLGAENEVVKKQPRAVAVPTLYGAENEVVKKQPRAVAVPTLYGAEDGDGEQLKLNKEDMLRDGTGNSAGDGNGPLMNDSGVMKHAGLANALMNVKNEQARTAIQRNMNRFMEKYQARFDKMENVEVETTEENGEVTIKAKEQVKYFGFIKGKATKRFEVQNNGQVTEKQPWYSFAYKNMNSE